MQFSRLLPSHSLSLLWNNKKDAALEKLWQYWNVTARVEVICMWSILWKNPRHKERITWFYLTSWIFLYFMNSVCIQWIPTIPRMPFSALDSNKSSCGVALNEVNPCNWKMDWWSRTGMLMKLMKLMERGAFFVHVSADWLAKLPNEHYLKIS